MKNCSNVSCDSTAKYLSNDLLDILSSTQMKDVQELLATIMNSAPSDLKDFIKWIAEIWIQDNASEVSREEKARLSLKEEVLKQVYKTELFKHVIEFLTATNTCNYFWQGAKIFCNERRTDVLIPYCEITSDGNCCCGSSHGGKMHPSIVDVVTILLLALPPKTWKGIQNEGLKKEIHRLTLTTDLSPLLEQELSAKYLLKLGFT